MRDRLRHELRWAIVCLSALLVAVLAWFGGALVHDYFDNPDLVVTLWVLSGLALTCSIAAMFVGTEYRR